jgi:1-acyl-sn-glycerol-3-phosphate acyltransferase
VFDALKKDLDLLDSVPKKRDWQFDRDGQIARRRLWRRLDKLRPQISETTKDSDVGREPPIVTSEEVRSLEKKLSLNAKGQFSLYGLIRLAALVAWLIVAFPWMLLAAPIRLVYPVFRRLGVHSNHLPLDYVHVAWSKVIVFIGGCEVFVEGMDYAKQIASGKSGGLLLFQHSSNLDGYLIQADCPMAFKWIGKKSILLIPIIGWLGYAYGAILYIDRENQQKAIKTLQKARDVMHKYRRSVAIAPEGTRSVTGQLVPFKKGPFHLAKDVKAPLLPVVIFGASELWPRNQFFTDTGRVVVRYLKPIKVEEYERLDYNELLELVRERMLDAMEKYPTENGPSRKLSLKFKLLHFTTIALVFTLFYLQHKWFLSWWV